MQCKMYSCDWLELSTPTNKLATYFGDDKPTSRSVLSDKPLEIKPVIRRVAQCWYWIGIGFACVKHCETYRARGFTAANQGSSSRINHCEGAIIAAISHDEQALPRDGRTGEQQLQMHVQQLQMGVQLCKYMEQMGNHVMIMDLLENMELQLGAKMHV